MVSAKIFFITVAFVITCSFSFSQSYFVDGVSGSNTNAGNSVGAAWKTFQKAFNAATPGSTVYIRGGTYHENVVANVSGTVGNPIVFTNYQSEVVILDGTGTSQNDMLYIEDRSNLVVENITVQNKVVNYATGVTISCTASGTVKNIILKNLKITGINWTSNASATPTSNNNSNPLLVYGQGTNEANAISNILIDSCEVYNNITGFSEAISLDGNVDTFMVSNNTVHDNKNIGILMAGNYVVSSNPLLDHTRNGRCFRNVCFNNISNYATSGGIYVDGGKNIVIEQNISYGNGYGIEIGCEENGSTDSIMVRDNLIYNNKQAGFAIGGYTKATTGQVLNSSVLNNTFVKNDYSSSGMGELYMSKLSNCKISNNVFYTTAQNLLISKDNITPFAGNVINYNCWFTPNNNSNSIVVYWGKSTYTTFANYMVQTGMDNNSVYTDPLLVNNDVAAPDFHLLSISSCIDKGDPLFVAGSGETDFYGGLRVVNSRVDIGAHEYSGTTVIYEAKKPLLFSLFPNPCDRYIQSDFGNLILNKSSQLKIYNVEGQEILNHRILSNNETIDVSVFPAGIYLFLIQTEDSLLRQNVLVIH